MKRAKRITVELSKSWVKKESVMGELEDVLEILFELFEKDTLQTFCTLLKETIEKRLVHASNTDVEITVEKLL